jgi:hypothetical protein
MNGLQYEVLRAINCNKGTFNKNNLKFRYYKFARGSALSSLLKD